MSRTFYFGNFAKRKNSTLQPTAAQVANGFNVLFKTPTSLDNPTITLTYSGDFDYNYAKYGNNYYFVTDKKSIHNDMWEISLELDPLATHKADIIASTQFVSYSASVALSPDLVDTRIPIRKNALVHTDSAAISILDNDGFYVLSVVGKNSAATYRVNLTNVADILAEISNWENDSITVAESKIDPQSISTTDFGDAITALNDTLASLGEAMINTGFVGNAYAAAPSCIRSCIWVPFAYALYDGSDHIYLGNFDTHVQARKLSTKPTTGTSSLTIPWQYTDWRRAQCENVYLYLPLVGTVALSTDDLVSESSLTINWSATATDGVICYEVLAGSQIIGTYGGNCSANYPIGVSQQASTGEIVNSIMAGAEKVVSTGVQASSSLNPAAWAVGAAGIGMDVANTAWDVINISNTRHNSCVGGIGGGAGSGLDLSAKVFVVTHSSHIEPQDVRATLGVPVMAPMALNNLTGYCQCANAHVAAAADSAILSQIDAYMNSGFYIE